MKKKVNPNESQVQPPSLGSVRPLVVSQPSCAVYVYTDGQPPSKGSVRPFVVSQPSGTGHVHTDGQPPSNGSVRPSEVSQPSGNDHVHVDGQPPSINYVARRIASQTGTSFKIMVSTGSTLIRKVWRLTKSNPFSRVSSWNKSPHSKSEVSVTSTSFSMSHQDTNLSYSGVSVFTYKELEDATQNFDPSRELGEGGFGVVYFGKLRDGRVVAVKKLHKHNKTRIEQFMNEVGILAHLRHRNLVSLYGCTSRLSRELLLVYEYVSNGTVADHLHGKLAKPNLLTWLIRLNIAIETASALVYLHASDVIHRDVKTNNILLDNNLCVKVADFGLSRLMPINVTHVSSAPQGTPGYLDPEYHQCYQLTEKSDVYSFGVVLIELISSMVAFDMKRSGEERILAKLALNTIQRSAVDQLIDPDLDTNPEILNMITLVAELASRCLQYDSKMRPTMNEVLDVLMDIQAMGRIDACDSITYLQTMNKLRLSETNDPVVLMKDILPSPVSVTRERQGNNSASSTAVSINGDKLSILKNGINA
ncbi:hypothetical protein SSX86_015940 [Deinandra increscens subsp. villosa]|uniref:Protein kinase domain-containing protein n=1 Tax=Deinandra increscens subsp. villosa TaxID=3103831 RepID=A0AAP0GV64_9ASTR